MTTVAKLKEQEAQAEEQLKQMLGDTGNEELETKTQEQVVEPAAEIDLVEENRKLNEALNALRGKYNAEVPRLTQQLRDTQKQLEEAKAAQKKAESDAEKANNEINTKLQNLRGDYGDDIIDALQSIADKTQETVQPQQEVSSEDTTERFWRNLRRRVPDFDELNTSSEFITWLQTPSSSGFTYQQVLNEAGSDLDYESCAEIFAQFKALKANKKAPKAEDFAAPPRGQQKREPVQKKQYSPQDWIKLQDDIRKGRYRGREAEAAALEKEIHAAIHGY